MNTRYLPVLPALMALAVVALSPPATAEEIEPAPGTATALAADAEAVAAPERVGGDARSTGADRPRRGRGACAPAGGHRRRGGRGPRRDRARRRGACRGGRCRGPCGPRHSDRQAGADPRAPPGACARAGRREDRSGRAGRRRAGPARHHVGRATSFISGRYQVVRTLLRDFASETVVRVANLPMATYPDAIKEAARLIDAGEADEAAAVLRAALGTLVVTETVYPHPLIDAEVHLDAAKELAEMANRTEKENDQLAACARGGASFAGTGRGVGLRDGRRLSRPLRRDPRDRAPNRGRGQHHQPLHRCAQFAVWCDCQSVGHAAALGAAATTRTWFRVGSA